MGQDNVGQFTGLHSVQGAAINTFPSHGPLWLPEGSGPLWLPFQVWTDPETTSPAPLPTVCCLPFALLWSQVSFIVNLPGYPGDEMQLDKGQCAGQSHALKETADAAVPPQVHCVCWGAFLTLQHLPHIDPSAGLQEGRSAFSQQVPDSESQGISAVISLPQK